MLTYAYMLNLTYVSGFITYSREKCPDPFSVSNFPCDRDQVIQPLQVSKVPSINKMIGFQV